MNGPSNDNRDVRCPICEKPSLKETRPFCSSRCQNVDLGRWIDGKYAIPSIESPDDSDLEMIIEEASRGDRVEDE